MITNSCRLMCFKFIQWLKFDTKPFEQCRDTAVARKKVYIIKAGSHYASTCNSRSLQIIGNFSNYSQQNQALCNSRCNLHLVWTRLLFKFRFYLVITSHGCKQLKRNSIFLRLKLLQLIRQILKSNWHFNFSVLCGAQNVRNGASASN